MCVCVFRGDAQALPFCGFPFSQLPVAPGVFFSFPQSLVPVTAAGGSHSLPHRCHSALKATTPQAITAFLCFRSLRNPGAH